MKILVTGGAGYIGSVVTAQLVEAGHEVIVVDDLSQGHQDALPPEVRFVKADITEIGTLFSPEDGIEAVLHFASLISAGESVIKPELYWHANTTKSLMLLDALRDLGVKKLIFSSTAAVYGNPERTPITEEDPKQPTNPYGMTKLAVDMAITSECGAHGLSAVSLRYFNVVGAYGRCGERHNPETHIIPLALAAAEGKGTFTVFGTDYPTPDGTCIRDYIHVADLARAHLMALDNIKPGHNIYNLGNGTGFSNFEVIAAVEAVTGKTLPYTIGPRRSGDPAILIASSEKAKRELGWVPEKPTLEEMVRDTWQFTNEGKV